MLVLGIHRSNGKYLGSPNGMTKVGVKDMLSVYGPAERLEELDLRKKGYLGDRAHKIAIETQKKTAEELQKLDAEDGGG